MSTVFVAPLAFTAASGSPSSTLPVTGAGNDLPGFAWVAPLASSYAILDLGTAGASYDWVALIGTNLRAGDTVRVQTGGATGGTGGSDTGAIPAWQGSKPRASRADSFVKLSGTRNDRFVRIDINAAGHPEGAISVFRIVVGKGVYAPGLTFDAEMGIEDQSVITTGPNFTSIDPYPVLQTWKVPINWTTETQWRGEILDLITTAGNQNGILFIANDDQPDKWQTDAMYGRITNKTGGKSTGYNVWAFELQMTSFVP